MPRSPNVLIFRVHVNSMNFASNSFDCIFMHYSVLKKESGFLYDVNEFDIGGKSSEKAYS